MELKLQQGRAPLISGRLCPVGRARGASVIQDWIEVRWPNWMIQTVGLLVTSPEFHRKIAQQKRHCRSKANTQHTSSCVARQQSMAGHSAIMPSFHLAARTPPQTQYPFSGPTYIQEGFGIIGRDWSLISCIMKYEVSGSTPIIQSRNTHLVNRFWGSQFRIVVYS